MTTDTVAATTDVLRQIDAARDAVLQRFVDWLAIPSVSTDPQLRGEVDKSAAWVAEHLRASGLVAQIVSADGGHPAVIAHSPDEMVANPSAPAVLFYGHHDVQPAAMEDGWSSPPFAPVVRDGVVTAPWRQRRQGRRVVDA